MPNKIIAQVTDTLANVELFSKKKTDIAASTVPVQQLNKTLLGKLNSVSVADAVKHFSGVIVKDYGGIGGLKTISVRSLGANHTGLMYDGVIIPDAQGGQVDLGRFSLDNIELIQLFNDQPTDILLPARTYASASVIALSSLSGSGNGSPGTNISARFKMGSFGFVNPSLYFSAQPGKRFRQSFNAEYQYAKGNYSFIDYETGHSRSKRTNSDIKSYRLEYDGVYGTNDSNQLKLKVYYYDSKRGLPGTVILYNPSSDERLNNNSFFAQLTWKKNISKKSRLLFSSKFTSDYKYYLDPSYANYAGKLENEFQQKEFYISIVYCYRIIPSLAASYSIDYFKSILKRTDQFALAFANPERDNLLHNLALQWKKRRFEINGNLLYTYIDGKVENGPVAGKLNELTEAVSASVIPVNKFPLRIRASYKNIFRAPSFDDLYYTNIGNTALRPEYAKQFDLGITIDKQLSGILKTVIVTADLYYNKVTDKILAVPRQNLFQWTMLNIGKADIRGLDIALHFVSARLGRFDFSSNLSYSLQEALDISDKSAASYLTQLPYTPEHSGSVNLNMNYDQLSFSYNIIGSSYRYRLGDQVEENRVKGWATHDLSIAYAFNWNKRFDYKILAEMNNIYNLQYEVIKYYPMPRFNYRVGLTMSFKK